MNRYLEKISSDLEKEAGLLSNVMTIGRAAVSKGVSSVGTGMRTAGNLAAAPFQRPMAAIQRAANRADDYLNRGRVANVEAGYAAKAAQTRAAKMAPKMPKPPAAAPAPAGMPSMGAIAGKVGNFIKTNPGTSAGLAATGMVGYGMGRSSQPQPY